jgi:hypothetical protein
MTSEFKSENYTDRVSEIVNFLKEIGKDYYADFLSENLPKLQSHENKVINYLSERNEPVPTLEISRYVHGKTATRKDINPLLYKMEREKIIVKTAEPDGTNPRWSLQN